MNTRDTTREHPTGNSFYMFRNYDNYKVQCAKTNYITKAYFYQDTGCVVLQKTIHSLNFCYLYMVPTSGTMHMTYSITYNTALSSKINLVHITIYKSMETVMYRHSPGIKPDTAFHSPAFNCGMVAFEQRDLSPFIASLHYQMRMEFKVAEYLVYHMTENQEPRFPVHTIGQVQFHLTAFCTGANCKWWELIFKFENIYFRSALPELFKLTEIILNLFIHSNNECSQLVGETTRLVITNYAMSRGVNENETLFNHIGQYFVLTNQSLRLRSYYEFLQTRFYSLHDNTSCIIYVDFRYTRFEEPTNKFIRPFPEEYKNTTLRGGAHLNCPILVCTVTFLKKFV